MTAAELFNLKGRVALVPGASSGLGVRFAEVLAREGAALLRLNAMSETAVADVVQDVVRARADETLLSLAASFAS